MEYGEINNEKVILVKPQTYMNLSGEAIIQLVNFYKIEKDKILVIYDDIDTKPGKIRIRKNGSAGTHNGMKSVVHCLGTEEFSRIRVGIGSPVFKGDLINYVINRIKDEEYNELEKGIDFAVNAVECILNSNIDKAMNMFN